jgi:omega-amidase
MKVCNVHIENTQVHLFDINVPGKMVFQESKVLTAGSSLNTVAMGSAWRVGLGICYDLRFAEMAHTYVQVGHGCVLRPVD